MLTVVESTGGLEELSFGIVVIRVLVAGVEGGFGRWGAGGRDQMVVDDFDQNNVQLSALAHVPRWFSLLYTSLGVPRFHLIHTWR